MPIPKQQKEQLTADNLAYREKDVDTIDLQFQEDAPVNKLIYTLRPEENAVITKISYAFGPNDNSINGYAHLLVTRVKNPSAYLLANGQNQVMFRRIAGASYIEGSQPLEKTPLYLHRSEEFYVYLFSNYPTPVKVFGNLTLYVLPTFA